MVPKIHKKGCSFMGLGRYVLHDEGADTSHRVGWTETINLGTRNPETAVKVMAAIAMDQERLKRESGVRRSGRKSKDAVLHVTLSWHPEEAKELTKAEQVKAAKWFLREIKADDRQALVVCHTDQEQPHVHLVINRVSPQDGRMLSSSFEKLNASKWALKYEQERGKVYCKNREINQAARKRGEYVRGKKDAARHIYEQQKQLANDNSKKQALIDEQRKRADELARQERQQRERRLEEWKETQQRWKNERRQQRADAKKELTTARDQVRKAFRPRWEELHHQQAAGWKQFEQNEQSLRGRMQNALQLTWKRLFDRGEGEPTLSDAFRILSSEGGRREALANRHKSQDHELHQEQLAIEKRALRDVRQSLPATLLEQRQQRRQERSEIIGRHQQEAADMKQSWKEYGRWRREAWKELELSPRSQELLRKFDEMSRGRERDDGIEY